MVQRIIRSGVLAGAVLAGALLIGCGAPNQYTPSATPTNLAAYAASVQYPQGIEAMDDSHLAAIVSRGSGDITLHNFGSGAVRNFNLWVNQAYVLHVDRIDPGNSRTFRLVDLYNSAGNSMENASAESIRRVEVQTTDGKLFKAQGPQME